MAADLSIVQVGITTKNRWDDLAHTLQKLVDFGLGHLRMIIVDDGSDHPCPFDITSICSRAEYIRHDSSQGLIVRRNELANIISSKYYLSLDDDSYPVQGSLLSAIEFADSCENVLCLSFPIFNPLSSRYQCSSLQSTPYQVRSFIGCGHLLDRERFLQLGGYRDELVHFLEETDLAVRGFVRGLYCFHFPGFEIHHLASLNGRNWARQDFYGSRNTVLWNDWYLPPRLRLVKQFRSFVSRLMWYVKTRRIGQLKGQWSGFVEVSRYKVNRQPMSLEDYRLWRSLPST